jgi:CRISPR-associated protein Cas2
MLVWVIYDIQENKPRNKVAQACKQAGLYRVQKSVFLGTMEANRFDELALVCEELIDTDQDSVYLFPFCQDDWQKIRLLGQAFDEKLVTDEVKALFV